jgi:tetratricopeptide (TPR) repeat protein
MKRKEGYPPLDDDKILDPLPDLEFKSIRSRGGTTRRRSERAVRRKRSKRPWKPFLLILIFAWGLGAGWLLHTAFSPAKRDVGKESGGLSRWFSSPFTGVRLEKTFKGQAAEERPTVLVLHPGEVIRLAYGQEFLRYLSLERRTSPLAALAALFVPAPGFYIEDRLLEPGEELERFLQPEKALSYALALKSSDGAAPSAFFQLELEIDAQGWLERAQLIEDPQSRRRCLEKALQSEPTSADLLMALGKLLWEQKENEKAIQRFQQLIEAHPEHIEARKALAVLYWKQDPRKALEIYTDLVKLDPEARLDYYKQIARLQERMGVSPAETYRKILSIKKDDTDAMQGMEDLYAERIRKAQEWEKKGQMGRAIREMKLALEIRSTKEGKGYLATLYNNLGYSLAGQGEFKEAIVMYEKSLYWNKDPVTYLNLAHACSKTDQVSMALKALEKADALRPSDREVFKSILLLWGELLMAENKPGEAIEKFKELNKHFSGDAQVLKALGMAYWKKGEYAEALEVLERLSVLLASGPAKERAELHRHMGDLHRTMGDNTQEEPRTRIAHYDKALKAYEQALSLNGKDKEAQKSWEEVAKERKALRIQILQSS